jgi:2-keto-4-pentenoate hydratase/2-oxohepta-3-ene-1,7-dioic acid hydratase in catechol pathway
MKLCTFEVATPLGPFERLGALTSAGVIVDLNAAFAAYLEADGETQPSRLAAVVLPPDMLAFLEMGATAADAARQAVAWVDSVTAAAEPLIGPRGEQMVYDRADVRLLAPLPRPASLRDFLAFEAHTRVGFARRGEPIPEAWYRLPVYYKGNPRSIVGPDADVRWPGYTERLDYELELACVIGRRGRDVDAEEAGRLIAGYTVMNDWSARDIQRAEMTVRLGPAKGKDFATSLGPVLVTPEELDARDLRMIARVNGEVWSDGNSGTSHWTFPQMIAHVAQDEDVLPGDVLGSGTVGGGCGLELDRWLRPGDVVELEIEGIGILRNRVIRQSA